MLARGQPRQIYEELIKLGADAKALDKCGGTVLHNFFRRMMEAQALSIPTDAFLDGGEILALLT